MPAFRFYNNDNGTVSITFEQGDLSAITLATGLSQRVADDIVSSLGAILANAKAEPKIAAEQLRAAAKVINKAAINRNGVQRPGADGICGRTWALFDEMTEDLGRPPAATEAIEEAEKRGLDFNPNNVKVEHSRWKRWNGITETLRKPRATAEG